MNVIYCYVVCCTECHDVLCLSDKMLVVLLGGKRKKLILAKMIL